MSPSSITAGPGHGNHSRSVNDLSTRHRLDGAHEARWRRSESHAHTIVAGWDVGYVSWAGCLPEDSTVIVVLSNGEVDDIRGMAHPLVSAGNSRSR